MAVKIRLRRMGQKKAPFYRIVVADSRSPRDGQVSSRRSELTIRTQIRASFKVDEEAAKKWLSKRRSAD